MTASAIVQTIPAKRSAQGDHGCCEGARRKRDDANDDRGLRHGLGLDFEGDFHAPSDGDGGEERGKLEEGGGEGARARMRNPGTVPTA